MKRQEQLKIATGSKVYDILIIGGGATGLGAALEASLQGYSVLLLEQYDFAKGTSSKATKLVHGGVRYLAQGDISLVREALKERGLLLKNAPDFAEVLDFIIPTKNLFQQLFYFIGLKVYDLLSGSYSLGTTQWVNQKYLQEKLPHIALKNTRGVLYYDGQFNDAKLAVALAQHTQKNGGITLNYIQVQKFITEDQRTIGVEALDTLSGNKYRFKAKHILNATGVLADDLLEKNNLNTPIKIAASKGSHLVVPLSFLEGTTGLMVPKTDDGRVLFAIPWQGKAIIGTTDELVDTKPIEPIVSPKELDFMVKHFNQYSTKKLEKKDILAVFSGLRPLVKPTGATSTKNMSRSHAIIHGPKGLTSIIGGKWTTYRKMGEQVIAAIAKKEQWPRRISTTKNYTISLESSSNDEKALLHPSFGYTKEQVRYAVEHEFAQKIEDVLARRTRLLFLDAKIALALAPLVADIMMPLLGKDKQWKDQELADFSNLAQKYLPK